MIKLQWTYPVPAALLLVLVACQPAEVENTPAPPPGIEVTYMDTTADPGNDFFRFANGGWLDQTTIPADRGRWGSFDELRMATSEKVLDVLQGAMEGDTYSEGSDQAKAALFYQTAMDTAHLDELGIAPLEGELSKVGNIQSLTDLQHYLAEAAPLQRGLFGISVRADINNSAVNAAYLGPGSLGLPDRDYYTKEDEESKELQEKYRRHIALMYGFLGYDAAAAEKAAAQVYELEHQMAEARMTKEERRNPLLRNNPRSVTELQQLMPAVDWSGYLQGIGAGKADTVIVTDLEYMQALNEVLTETQLPAVKEYLRWTLLNGASDFLSTDIEQASFDFYGKELRGTQEMRPRWERVLDVANWSIGEAIGKLYVDGYFPPEAKASAEEMVDNIKAAFGERIKQLDWMSESTKEKALEKLSTFRVKIAYPDNWKDYSQLIITGPGEGGSYLANLKNVRLWNWREDMEKIGEPVDKDEWFMAPQIVNAYYNPTNNEIVFPAAILQPPFYNYQADPAVNYGGIGAVIGHEISHGFDDQGSRYDKDGNLKNWWTDEDRQRFEALTKKLAAQYDAYEPLEGVRVNGQFTLGENIGDLGGINVAFDGLQRHLAQHGNPGPIDGFSQDQRFFISWASIWRTKYRDEALKNQINTDPHSPGMYRAVGPAVNVPAFYEAFDISEGDALYRPESARVKIW